MRRYIVGVFEFDKLENKRPFAFCSYDFMKAVELLRSLEISYFYCKTAAKILVAIYLPLTLAALELKLHFVSNCSAVISVFFIIF